MKKSECKPIQFGTNVAQELLNISLARSSKGADNNSLSVVSPLIATFQYFFKFLPILSRNPIFDKFNFIGI